MALDALSSGRSALVAYGSETGTAQDIAEEIGRLTRRLRFATRVLELDNVNLNDLIRCDVVIIAVSTTGQGDLPVNARSFWKKLRSGKLRQGVLAKVCFTAFGIGDSSYPNFNWASRKLSNRLLQLGAQCFCDRGESDEQHPDGIDGLFFPWSTTLREKLLQRFPLPDGLAVIPDEEFLTPEWKLQVSVSGTNGAVGQGQEPTTNGTNGLTHDVLPNVAKLPAKLESSSRLTPESHFQDVRLFEFSTPTVNYSPGDVLTIFPRSPDEDVDELIKIMRWEEVASHPVHFVREQPPGVGDRSTDSDAPLEVDALTTFRDLVQQHLDLNAIPRRSFFASLAHFTDDEMQEERLTDFTKPELIDELYDYTTRPRRSILEVLQEFDTIKIPWQWAASIFPHIRGRQFSIASGGSLKQGVDGRTRVQLLVAIVKYKTVIKKIRQGLCTRYLCGLREGDHLQVALSKSGMQVALDKPAIMVGPGTGVAPLRAMVHERAATDAAYRHVPQLLFFGARNHAADYFFADEWQDFVRQERLQIHAAFSRDQDSKIYVQDKIRQCAGSVFQLLQQDGVVYVCGSSGKMPQAVRTALADAVEEEGRMAREDAERYLVEMEKSGRYQQETW